MKFNWLFISLHYFLTVWINFNTWYVIIFYTHTPCGFLLVGAAFSSCLGDPIMRRVLPLRWCGAPLPSTNSSGGLIIKLCKFASFIAETSSSICFFFSASVESSTCTSLSSEPERSDTASVSRRANSSSFFNRSTSCNVADSRWTHSSCRWDAAVCVLWSSSASFLLVPEKKQIKFQFSD